MVEVSILPKYMSSFVLCVDASEPTMEVDNWVTSNCIYRLMGFTDAMNQSDSRSFLIADPYTNEMIYPTNKVRGFREDRFIDYMDFYWN